MDSGLKIKSEQLIERFPKSTCLIFVQKSLLLLHKMPWTLLLLRISRQVSTLHTGSMESCGPLTLCFLALEKDLKGRCLTKNRQQEKTSKETSCTREVF